MTYRQCPQRGAILPGVMKDDAELRRAPVAEFEPGGDQPKRYVRDPPVLRAQHFETRYLLGFAGECRGWQSRGRNERQRRQQQQPKMMEGAFRHPAIPLAARAARIKPKDETNVSDPGALRYVVTLMSSVRRSSVTSARSAPPPLGHLWREARALTDVRRRFPVASKARAANGGAPLIVVPGFLSSDASTGVLRGRLAEAGYDVRGWGQGLNLGASEERLARLADDVSRLARQRERPVSLVGWSLGGLYAREIAKRVPDDVARVVTLGSPFSGDPRANRVWWLYEWLNRHPVDDLPIVCDLSAKPPVPTIALWSRDDGIVSSSCARGLPHEADAAIEVSCCHIGFTFEPAALDAVVAALHGAQPGLAARSASI